MIIADPNKYQHSHVLINYKHNKNLVCFILCFIYLE